MADITKCENELCKEKQNCYRYKAKSNPYYQSYNNFKDICNNDNNYEMKIKTGNTNKENNHGL